MEKSNQKSKPDGMFRKNNMILLCVVEFDNHYIICVVYRNSKSSYKSALSADFTEAHTHIHILYH